MKAYASMSDFEINKAVAVAAGHHPDECDIAKIGSSMVGVEWDDDTGYATKAFDFCNNPADAWPIIIGQKLSLINADDEWLCVPDYATVDGVAGEDIQKIYFSYGYVDANPLRCAMVVFLMMKEGE